MSESRICLSCPFFFPFIFTNVWFFSLELFGCLMVPKESLKMFLKQLSLEKCTLFPTLCVTMFLVLKTNFASRFSIVCCCSQSNASFLSSKYKMPVTEIHSLTDFYLMITILFLSFVLLCASLKCQKASLLVMVHSLLYYLKGIY